MGSKEHDRQYRLQRMIQTAKDGVCYYCRKPVEGGKRYCPECAKKQTDYNRSRRDRLSAKGLCASCGKAPAREGRKLCEDCQQRVKNATFLWREKNPDYKDKINARIRENGLCRRCWKPAETGRTLCAACSELNKVYSKERRQKLIAQHLCTQCGKHPPLEGKKLCAACNEAAAYARHKKARRDRYKHYGD